MQTERVTFLTTPDHKAALDAYAAKTGKSVGNVVREATTRYIARPPQADGGDEAALALLLDELEAAMPRWNAQFDTMEASLDHAHDEVRKALAIVAATQ